MDYNVIAGYVSLALVLIRETYHFCKTETIHKRIRSRCCGAENILSIDLDNNTPTTNTKIVIPPQNALPPN